jgi:hypothetical protein
MLAKADQPMEAKEMKVVVDVINGIKKQFARLKKDEGTENEWLFAEEDKEVKAKKAGTVDTEVTTGAKIEEKGERALRDHRTTKEIDADADAVKTLERQAIKLSCKMGATTTVKNGDTTVATKTETGLTMSKKGLRVKTDGGTSSKKTAEPTESEAKVEKAAKSGQLLVAPSGGDKPRKAGSTAEYPTEVVTQPIAKDGKNSVNARYTYTALNTEYEGVDSRESKEKMREKLQKQQPKDKEKEEKKSLLLAAGGGGDKKGGAPVKKAKATRTDPVRTGMELTLEVTVDDPASCGTGADGEEDVYCVDSAELDKKKEEDATMALGQDMTAEEIAMETGNIKDESVAVKKADATTNKVRYVNPPNKMKMTIRVNKTREDLPAPRVTPMMKMGDPSSCEDEDADKCGRPGVRLQSGAARTDGGATGMPRYVCPLFPPAQPSAVSD